MYPSYLNQIDARSLYLELLGKWKTKEGDEPSNDCLAIARKFYCAVAFPRCESNEKVYILSNKYQQSKPLCKFMCNLWADRCPNETMSYCEVKAQDKICTYGVFIQQVRTILLIVGVLYLVTL